MTNKIFRIFLILAVASFFAWILNFHLIFSGKLTVSNNFKDPNSFISNIGGGLEPVEEINTGEVYQEVRSDSASINFYIPPKTEKIDIKLKIENPNQALFYSYEDNLNNSYFYLLQNLELKELDWERKELGEYLVFYKPGSSEPYDINGLIANKRESVRNYKAPEIFNNSLSLAVDAWQAQNYYSDISLPLRGDHVLFFYVANDGILDVKIDYNQKVISDNKLKEKKVGFGANLNLHGEELFFNNDSKKSKDSIDLYRGDLTPGFYRVELIHDNDVTINNIKTHNPFYIDEQLVTNNPNKELNLQTNSEYLSLYTVHGSGEQEINVGDSTASVINRQKTESEKLSGINNIQASFADFEIIGSSDAKFIPSIFNESISDFILNNSSYNPSELEEENSLVEYIIVRKTDYFIDNLEKYTNSDDYLYFSLYPEDLYINQDNIFVLHLIIPNKKIKVEKIKATYYRNFFNYLGDYFK